MKARRGALLAVLLSVALTGCVAVPRVGDVLPATASAAPVNPGVQIVPLPPRPDGTPTEIVEGFIHAMTSAEGDYAAARAYLTAASAAEWKPTSGVVIYADAATVLTDGHVVLRSTLLGRLDERGEYRQDASALNIDFGAVQDASGQWRISSPPTGLLLSSNLFSAAFVRVNTYFWAENRTWLVPDPRYVPRGAQGYERALKLEIAGPTQWLAPAVRGMDAGLGVRQVAISRSGLATVTLADARGLGADDRAGVVTQLAWVLSQFEVVQNIAVVGADGVAWTTPEQGAQVPVDSFASADPVDHRTNPQLFASSEGKLRRVTEGGRGVELVPANYPSTAVASIAVSWDESQAATVNAAGDQLTFATLTGIGTGTPKNWADIRRPDYSRQGELWVPQGGRVQVLHGTTWHETAVGGAPEGEVMSIRLSPDGVRAAVVIRAVNGVGVLGIARVVRTVAGPELEGWRSLGAVIGTSRQASVLDAGWSADSTLLLLEADGGSTFVVEMGQEGASAVSKGPAGAGDLVELEVAPRAAPVVRSADGSVFRYTSTDRWQTLLEKASGVAYAS